MPRFNAETIEKLRGLERQSANARRMAAGFSGRNSCAEAYWNGRAAMAERIAEHIASVAFPMPPVQIAGVWLPDGGRGV